MAAAPSGAQDAPPFEWGASVSVGSDYVVHGLSRSRGRPVVKASGGAAWGRGWSATVGASTMDLNPGRGPSRELSLYLGRSIELDDATEWRLLLSGAIYEYATDTQSNYDYIEASAALTWRERLHLRAQYSPDYSILTLRGPASEFSTWTGEVGWQQPIVAGLTLTAAAGFYDLEAGTGRGFWFWSAGGVWSRGRLSAAVTLTDVDGTALNLLGPRFARTRLAAAIAWRVR
jgi:uncharacterized protein (TIGR02001 family)